MPPFVGTPSIQMSSTTSTSTDYCPEYIRILIPNSAHAESGKHHEYMIRSRITHLTSENPPSPISFPLYTPPRAYTFSETRTTPYNLVYINMNRKPVPKPYSQNRHPSLNPRGLLCSICNKSRATHVPQGPLPFLFSSPPSLT